MGESQISRAGVFYAFLLVATLLLLSFSSVSASEKVKVASFNIQVFGQTKASNTEVMNVLANIARNFDLIAIQEIRDSSQTAMPTFKEKINAMPGPDYDFIIGPRLGRTTSKEQYAYLYNTATIEVTTSGITYLEPEDVFHREPFIAPFKAKNGNFDFVLINIHTDPDAATDEINYLPNVVDYARRILPDEKDFIVLGDFNADCDYFDEDASSPLRSAEYLWLIENTADTTTKATDCTYDRIVTTKGAATDYAGESGVFKFDTIYGLTNEETIDVSDHYPVYAVFWINKDRDAKPTKTGDYTIAAAAIAVAGAVGYFRRRKRKEKEVRGFDRG